MEDARSDAAVGAVILCGAGELAFCSGGDQTVRGAGGYVGDDGVARLNVLDLQVQIRRMPKPVVAMVAGYAVGGGHILHMVCDLTIAADNAVFGQTGPKVTLPCPSLITPLRAYDRHGTACRATYGPWVGFPGVGKTRAHVGELY